MNRLPVYKTEGIILKTADLGELDRLLIIYTKGYGKISARAISVRKKESKLRGLLQSFVYARFLLAKSRTIDIVTDVEILDNFNFLRGNLFRLGLAFYFSELVDKLVVAPERDENLWRLILRGFEVLNQPGVNLSKIKTAFEEKLLEFLGHPGFEMRGKISPHQKAFYLESLVGGPIKSTRFLTSLNLYK